ncbi:MAG TPA: NIPSNAP family protein [Bryobacteraceae bacterium]|nr:NIPSNAP family protein [Bryobacteraceae bacterium]
MVKRLLLLVFLTVALALAKGPVYELRTYTAADGKLDALKARFKDHTIRIFKKHGMESIGYWVPEDPVLSKNTLIYILKHPSREDGEKHWMDFQNDPEWKKVSAASEASGKLVLKVERVWLDPTEFSALK